MSTWRTGRKLGRTIYDGDVLIGIMDRAEDADLVVRQREQIRPLRAALQQCLDSLRDYDTESLERFQASIAKGEAALEATKELESREGEQ